MKLNTVAQMVVRIAGLVQLVLGVIVWPGKADSLIPVHVVVGLILVVALLVLIYLAARSQVPTALVVAGVIWAILLPVIGLTQEELLPDTAHWVIQVLHLLIGVGAVGIAESLGGQIKKSLATAR